MGKPRDMITSRQNNRVQNFISDQAPQHHQAFQKRGFFDQQRRQYVAWAPHHDLAVALERYQEGNHPSASIISIRECSWDDVLEEMAHAEDEYHAKGHGSLNFVRKGLRKAGDYAPAINPWLDLIPEGDGLKTLSSGLKLVFTIARQQAEHREKILGGFRDFVTILDNTQEKRRLFRADEKLRVSAVDLYETVLCAITNLINLLNHRSWKKKAASFIQGPLSSNEVDEILSDVTKKLDEFRRCLEDLRDRKLNSIYQTVTSGESELHAVRLNTKNIEVDVRDVQKSLHGFTEQANTTHLKIDNVYIGVAQISQKIDQLIASHAFEAQTWLYHHLLDTIKSYETQISRSHQTDLPRYQMLQLPQFLEALQVSHLSPTQDLEYVTRQGPTFNAKAQIQAQALTNSPEFQRWLSSKRSGLLLVDGNADPADPSRISPLSVVCATLSLSLLKGTSKPLILHFFCGQHTAMTDPLGGPKGLIRSLVTQLLYSGRRFDIDFIDSRTYRESLEAHSLQHLCDSFGKLIEQLPLDTNVFCILDGVSLYETGSWLDEMSYVFETINSITLEERSRPVLKVLLTSAHTSRFLKRRVVQSQYVSLQAGALNGRAISERAMAINISGTKGRQLRPVLTQEEGESSSDDYEDDWGC